MRVTDVNKRLLFRYFMLVKSPVLTLEEVKELEGLEIILRV